MSARSQALADVVRTARMRAGVARVASRCSQVAGQCVLVVAQPKRGDARVPAAIALSRPVLFGVPELDSVVAAGGLGQGGLHVVGSATAGGDDERCAMAFAAGFLARASMPGVWLGPAGDLFSRDITDICPAVAPRRTCLSWSAGSDRLAMQALRQIQNASCLAPAAGSGVGHKIVRARRALAAPNTAATVHVMPDVAGQAGSAERAKHAPCAASHRPGSVRHPANGPLALANATTEADAGNGKIRAASGTACAAAVVAAGHAVVIDLRCAKTLVPPMRFARKAVRNGYVVVLLMREWAVRSAANLDPGEAALHWRIAGAGHDTAGQRERWMVELHRTETVRRMCVLACDGVGRMASAPPTPEVGGSKEMMRRFARA